MRIVSLVGARPEFIQLAPLSRALSARHEEIIIHTGQHYDAQLSSVFFSQLRLPEPTYNLGVGSLSPCKQVARMMLKLEEVLERVRPDILMVRGDTNSTLAGALAGEKMRIPVAHLEAGERSANRAMPEEVNRIIADRVASLHFCVNDRSRLNLVAEGISHTAHVVGDLLLDALRIYLPEARKSSSVLERLNLQAKQFVLCTIHRESNTSSRDSLSELFQALSSSGETIIFPLHPRTRGAINKFNLLGGSNIRFLEPISYFDMLVLEDAARLIVTDSGGVQREAYCLGIPCLTWREETEWIDTVSAGWNKVVGTCAAQALAEWHFRPPSTRPDHFGTGDAAGKILDILNSFPS